MDNENDKQKQEKEERVSGLKKLNNEKRLTYMSYKLATEQHK